MAVAAAVTVVGVQWLRSCERRLHKTVSSMLVYFLKIVNADPTGVWFGGRKRPVASYEFGRVPVVTAGGW